MPEDHRRDPDAQHRAEAVARLRGDADRPEAQEQIEPDEDGAADEAPLLREDGEREVGGLVGDEAELVLHPLEVAVAHELPVADGDAGVVGVPSRLQNVRLGVEEHLDAGALIVEQHVLVGHVRADDRRAEEEEDAAPLELRHRGDGEEDEDVDHRRAEIRLPEDEEGRHEGDEGRHEQILERAPLVLRVVVEVLGEGEDEGELRELARLELEAAELDPSRGAAEVSTEHQRQDEHEDAHRVRDVGGALEVPVVEGAQDRPHDPRPEEPVELADVALGDGALVDARRGVEVHHPEEGDAHGGDEERPIEARREPLALPHHGVLCLPRSCGRPALERGEPSFFGGMILPLSSL